jgi:hypothetical protein
MTSAKIRAQVVASRRAQGLPDCIADQAFLDRLAVHILAAQHNGGPGTRRGRRDRHAAAMTAEGRSDGTP